MLIFTDSKIRKMPLEDRKTMSIDNMRIGKSYHVKNHGERTSFLILEAEGSNNFLVKDLLTLETYYFNDLIRFGIGEDFELFEI